MKYWTYWIVHNVRMELVMIFNTPEEAQLEAERLANLHMLDEFFVLKAVRRVSHAHIKTAE